MSRKIIAANPRKSVEIENRAKKIISLVQPEALQKPTPFNVEKFFELYMEDLVGVRPDYHALPYGIHGYTDLETNVSVISSALIDDPKQERFVRSTMAHEAGHATIHIPEFRFKKTVSRFIHDSSHSKFKLYRQEDIPVYMNPEWQAWRFAGALLMPAETVKSAIIEGMDRRDMADAFNVNPAFVDYRVKALKLKINKKGAFADAPFLS